MDVLGPGVKGDVPHHGQGQSKDSDHKRAVIRQNVQGQIVGEGLNDGIGRLFQDVSHVGGSAVIEGYFFLLSGLCLPQLAKRSTYKGGNVECCM